MYGLKQTQRFQKDLQILERKNRIRILEKIALLAKGRDKELDIKKLRGIENCYRLRSGNYRILYEKRREELVIILISVRHRKESYR